MEQKRPQAQFKKRTKKSISNSKPTVVELTTPWGSNNQYVKTYNGNEASDFVKRRTDLHDSYIKETEKTKRIALFLAVILVLSASSILCFAPVGKETVAIWISASLFVFAAGSAGYKRVWGKSKFISFGADNGR
jgi:hypothetical protein